MTFLHCFSVDDRPGLVYYALSMFLFRDCNCLLFTALAQYFLNPVNVFLKASCERLHFFIFFSSILFHLYALETFPSMP